MWIYIYILYICSISSASLDNGLIWFTNHLIYPNWSSSMTHAVERSETCAEILFKLFPNQCSRICLNMFFPMRVMCHRVSRSPPSGDHTLTPLLAKGHWHVVFFNHTLNGREIRQITLKLLECKPPEIARVQVTEHLDRSGFSFGFYQFLTLEIDLSVCLKTYFPLEFIAIWMGKWWVRPGMT